MILALSILAAAICGAGATLSLQKLLAVKRGVPASRKSAEMEKTERRVSRIQSADLAQYLEVATTANFEAVHAWTRSATPLERAKNHHEALAAARLQAALLEEQGKRGLV